MKKSHADAMKSDIPWNSYPRPQLRRNSFLNLNGSWEFALAVEGETVPDSYPDRILVPFCPESKLSGLHIPILPRQIMYYRRRFSVKREFLSDRTLLHFGAVDQSCRVCLNGKEIGCHDGGYLPFSFDISNEIQIGENEILVIVSDPLNHDLPWGKQKYQHGGMWYTPVSGIWQTVWIESMSADAIRQLNIVSSLNTVRLHLESSAAAFTVSIPEIGYRAVHDSTDISIPITDPHLWTPQDPHLYHFTIATEHDTVESYFALRTVSVGKNAFGFPCVLLNGVPLFLNGILDQGYYPDGIYTPASPDVYEFDIQTAKRMGYNLIRKHIKVESAVFYALCDRLGMLVMQDFVNTGRYSFLRDTVLPTVGLRKLPNILRRQTEESKAFFLQNAVGTQKLLMNSPCVIAYTIFNEGWGQFSADRVWDFLRRQDPSRLYDTASGWFRPSESDFDSRHIYFRSIHLRAGEKPLLLSEFGGYSYHHPAHSCSEKEYGYRRLPSSADLEVAIIALYEEQIQPHIRRGLCGCIYTQFADVEEETNGLMTYDRQITKVSVEKMNAMASKLTF